MVAFFGDSITAQGLYPGYVEAWSLTRFAHLDLQFFNAGLGSDRASWANSRFATDVAPLRPSVVTVSFGMNDGEYNAFDLMPYKAFMAGLRDIAKKIHGEGARSLWLTPNAVEKKETGPALKGYNETLEKFASGIQEVADDT